MTGAVYWRCFHCGDTFTKAQVRHARDHFGRDEGETPACLIREPGEYHVLRALRQAQDELVSYRAEDTELWRALHAMSSDHRQALIREEERGYAKGAADARAEASAPHLLADYHEDIGPVLWWWPGEPPYCGMPYDCDWPGYHQWWTPLPAPPTAIAVVVDAARTELVEREGSREESSIVKAAEKAK